MEIKNKPEKIETFVYGLMKEARRNGLYDLFEEAWDISAEEVDECITYLESTLGFKI